MIDIVTFLGQLMICAAFVILTTFFLVGSAWLVVQFHYRLKDYRATP